MKKFWAEFIGTFALILVGTGAAVLVGGPEGAGILAIAFAFGLTVVGMAYSVGTVSGAHLNPAVSIAMFVNKRLSAKELLTYVGAQLAGATLGSAMLYLFLSSANMDTTNLGATTLATDMSLFGGFVIEAVLTFLFVLIIMTTTGKNGNPHTAGLIIGLSLSALIFAGATLTGASYNPARSFGPALLVGGTALAQLWLYVLATSVGAVVAALVAKYVLDTELGAPGAEQDKLTEEK